MNFNDLRVAVAGELEQFATQEYHNKITSYNITGLTLALGAIITEHEKVFNEEIARLTTEVERIKAEAEAVMESGEET